MDAVKSTGQSSKGVDQQEKTPRSNILSLTIAIVITTVITIYPLVLTNESGQADHLAATLALWSMSAGYVRGVGFVPRNRCLRVLFSKSACVLALSIAAALIAQHRLTL